MADISRRTAMTVGWTVGGIAAIGIAVPATGAFAAGQARAATSSARSTLPTRSQFVGAIGQVFTATAAGHSYPVTLTAIHDLEPVAVAKDENRFNLIFESRQLRREGIFSFSRDGVPTTRLFVSPIGGGERIRTFQAIVNRTA